jgi:hypothetical protein
MEQEMDYFPFAVTLVAIALPMVGLLALAAWLVERHVGRVKVVDRQGRTVAVVVLDRGSAGD